MGFSQRNKGGRIAAIPAARSLPGSVSPARYSVTAPVKKLRAYEPRTALSLAFMVLDVAVDLVLNAIQARGNDAVVDAVLFH